MNYKLKIFTKPNCPNCPKAKSLGETLQKEGKIGIEFYNVEDADGLAEAQLYSVLATPTIILCNADSDEDEVKSWRGDTPNREEIDNLLN